MSVHASVIRRSQGLPDARYPASFVKVFKLDLTMAIVGHPMEPRSGILATPLTLPSTLTLRRWHGRWSPASGFTSVCEFARCLNCLAVSSAPSGTTSCTHPHIPPPVFW